MELRHLRYFLAVAEHLHFGRAAEALHTAQPSLSQQILQLERELGVRLFERTKRHVALTEEGRLFLPEARALVERVASLSETMRGAASSPRGPLQVGSITASTMGVLPRVLPSFRDRYPLVRFSVETLPIDEQLHALIERRIDVGILRLPVADERLATAPIAKEALCLALSREHPLASRPSIPLRAIDGETLITMRPERAGGFYEGIWALFRRHGVRIAAAVETPDIETCIALVACGMGVGIVSAVMLALALEGVVYRPLAPGATIETMAVAWRRDRAGTPAVRAFVDHVRGARLTFTAPGDDGGTAHASTGSA
ncbi:MAG TPA: LysR substrate-binding domain-containing protein [Candidatus Limnocylindria bacterium]|jgi:DNA-binding transcriptional LysR family regulator|nr:LysR substrate-binding domain-containing protein [Candidatus Limnocylindria bacterium]